MKHSEDTFKSTDGLEMYCQAWLPDEPPRASLAVVHGFGEHSGRYLNLVNYFVPRGYALYAFDHRGHGRSPGQRGYVRRFQDYLLDVQEFLRVARAAQAGRKLFLVGHSMGGLIALAFAIHHPQAIDAVLVSSPMLGLDLSKAPGWKVGLVRTLAHILPALSLENVDLRNEDLSHDASVVAAAGADPLNHRKITPGWFNQMEKGMAETLAHAGELRVPLLLMYAGADKVVDGAQAPVFFERVTHPDKTLRVYADYYHELFNEVGKEAVFKDMEQWLAGRV